MERLARARVSLIFLLLGWGVKPIWPVQGFLMLYICVWTEFTDVMFYVQEELWDVF